MAYAGKQPIGTMLIQAGKLDEDQLQTALREQQKKDGYILLTALETPQEVYVTPFTCL